MYERGENVPEKRLREEEGRSKRLAQNVNVCGIACMYGGTRNHGRNLTDLNRCRGGARRDKRVKHGCRTVKLAKGSDGESILSVRLQRLRYFTKGPVSVWVKFLIFFSTTI